MKEFSKWLFPCGIQSLNQFIKNNTHMSDNNAVAHPAPQTKLADVFGLLQPISVVPISLNWHRLHLSEISEQLKAARVALSEEPTTSLARIAEVAGGVFGTTALVFSYDSPIIFWARCAFSSSLTINAYMGICSRVRPNGFSGKLHEKVKSSFRGSSTKYKLVPGGAIFVPIC